MSQTMLNFTVGPVTVPEHIRAMGSDPIPYFRTAEFSALMAENETMLKQLVHAPHDARAVFLTGSGTFAMEASVANLLTARDRILVVNGGSFGARFSQLCDIYGLNHTDILLPVGLALHAEHLAPYAGKGYTALLVNLHETSTGVLYNLDLIADFCHREGLLLIVDAISAFLADEIDMSRSDIDALITSSQKALALAPGLSMMVMSQRALDRISENQVQSLYLDLKDALRNMERGQTPFTPAVGLLIQLHRRFSDITELGIEAERAKIRALAEDFRARIAASELPFVPFPETPSNAVTALRVTCQTSAHRIFEILKDQYGIWICPNGGELRDSVFRVGHLGALTTADNETLVTAFADCIRKGLIQ